MFFIIADCIFLFHGNMVMENCGTRIHIYMSCVLHVSCFRWVRSFFVGLGSCRNSGIHALPKKIKVRKNTTL